jgi:hypothetical protein
VKLHPMTLARTIIVKTNPGPGGVKLGAHRNSVAATVTDRQIRSQRQNVIYGKANWRNSGWRTLCWFLGRSMAAFERQFSDP